MPTSKLCLIAAARHCFTNRVFYKLRQFAYAVKQRFDGVTKFGLYTDEKQSGGFHPGTVSHLRGIVDRVVSVNMIKMYKTTKFVQNASLTPPFFYQHSLE